MRRFVAYHHAPWLAIAWPIEPLLGHVRNDRGVVSLDYFSFGSIDIELGIKILALPFVRYEPIESWTWFVIFFTHVPFAEIGSVVALRLQNDRKALEARRILSEVVGDTVGVGIETAKDAGAAWGAQRCGAECISKIDPFSAKAIHIRRLEVFASTEADSVPALIVRENEENIGLFVGSEYW